MHRLPIRIWRLRTTPGQMLPQTRASQVTPQSRARPAIEAATAGRGFGSAKIPPDGEPACRAMSGGLRVASALIGSGLDVEIGAPGSCERAWKDPLAERGEALVGVDES